MSQTTWPIRQMAGASRRPSGATAFASLMRSTAISCCRAIRNTETIATWAQFDQAGRLVTTSYDGFVRLYAANQYATPIARFKWKGHRPYSAVFSPDSTRVAVGDDDSHDVVVLSGSDLTKLFNADTTGIPDDGDMIGSRLVAGRALPLCRWLLVGQRRVAGAALERRRPRGLCRYIGRLRARSWNLLA